MGNNITLHNFIGHLHTVNTHRRLVRKLCFKIGLYRQGLTHDLSKYSYTEFWSGVRYYQGNKSPITAEIKEKSYSEAWLHHKGRNKHHWQYWISVKKGVIVPNEMPIKYIKEMACDRIAACMTYEKEKYRNSSALEFLLSSSEQHAMPPKTVETLKKYLTIVAENDLDTALGIIKEMDK